ncbi:hypothetical protein ABW21_db0208076 [Orbilia brochopaga]|nr:hypothetical protein ABW21_db0208076 [Drechslerella brochopaga]
MDPALLQQPFRLVNLAVATLMILGGVAQYGDITAQHIVESIYLFVFGLSVAFLEFRSLPQVYRYASFMFSFIGRGCFYAFVGAILYHKSPWSWVPGLIIGVIGVAYVALEFVPSIEPPENMRDPDSGYDGLGDGV